MPASPRLAPVLLLLAACSGTATKDSGSADGACPPAACDAGSECLEAATPGDAATFTLRASQIAITAPEALAQGLLGDVLGGVETPALPDCGVAGPGAWSLLLGFDTSAETLEIASARPVAAGSAYTAMDERFGDLQVSPVTTSATVGADGSFTASNVTAVLAVFLDTGPSDPLLLPVDGARIDGTLSPSHACIGAYDDAAMEAVSCAADADHPAFTEGATLTGFIPLEAADESVFAPLNQSLCVLLARDSATYGDGGSPAHCLTDANNDIAFRGDWCSLTNAAGDAMCADAMKFSFSFAASAL